MTKEEIKEVFARPKLFLAEERRRQNITKVKAAEWLGIDQNTYAKKENGESPFKDYEMAILAMKLGADPKKLFFGE